MMFWADHIRVLDVYRSIRVLTQLPKSKGKGKAKAGRLDGLDKLSGRPLEKYRRESEISLCVSSGPGGQAS